MSLAFFAWSDVRFALLLAFYAMAVYGLGVLVFHWRKRTVSLPEKTTFDVAKTFFVVGLILVIGILFFYKYVNFFLGIFNGLFSLEINSISLLVPLGISYVTFSSVSYLVDIYRGDETPRNLIDTMLYLVFFPKISSGPIVLYKDFFAMQWKKNTAEQWVSGINRIIIGISKKVIVADYFCGVIEQMGNISSMDQETALLSILLYGFQIYFDFSGYSDMAIGLGRLLGFPMKENFNFPYRSLSITEFWRRWHISLGTIFREYLYIPLGGNRRGKKKTLLNLAIVFFLTGLWHGAGFNYILWGMIHGVAMIFERIGNNKDRLEKVPAFVRWLGTMIIVFVGWEFFRYGDLYAIKSIFWVALGIQGNSVIPFSFIYYFDLKMVVMLIVAVIGSTWWGSSRILKRVESIRSKTWTYALMEGGLLILFILDIIFMINSSYSPFIYFQY